MSTNKEFLRDPAKFISGMHIAVPANVGGGKGKFTLNPQAANYCMLAAGGGIDAYYLKALPNDENMAQLPNDVRIMFTDALSGCQFLAYGANRDSVVVEHNNYIADPGGYATRLGDVSGLAGANFLVSVSATGGDEYDVAGHVQTVGYDQAGTANIIGVRGDAGWQFYVRQQGMSNKGTVLGPL